MLTSVVVQNHVRAVRANNHRLILNSDLHVSANCQHSILRRHHKWAKTSEKSVQQSIGLVRRNVPLSRRNKCTKNFHKIQMQT